MSYNFGQNPIDHAAAYYAAVQSAVSVEHAIVDTIQNSIDANATAINVKFNGFWVDGPDSGNPIYTSAESYKDLDKRSPTDYFKLTSVTIVDNGCGMSHDDVLERLRGAFQHSASHESASKTGKNGVGFKTNFMYWCRMDVATTTNGYIPGSDGVFNWVCNDPQTLKLVEDSYRELSTLKPGDPDTELRRYIVKQSGCVADKWSSVWSHSKSGTTITLRDPRGELIVRPKTLIDMLSKQIGFLGTHGHQLTFEVEERTKLGQASIFNTLKPFYEINPPKSIVTVTGSSLGTSIIATIGVKSSEIPPASKDLDPIYFDLKLADREERDVNTFIICVCGVNVFGDDARDAIFKVDKFNNKIGFGNRLYGYIKTDSLHLKNALRHNKTALDINSPYVKKFYAYVVSTVLKAFNKAYADWQRQFSAQQETEIIAGVQTALNEILRIGNRKINTPNLIPSVSHVNQHAEWVCNNCNCKWKTPKNLVATFCAEFSDTAIGCGSRDISRATVNTNDIKIRTVPFIGNFLPARYEPDDAEVIIAEFHPAHQTTLTGHNRVDFKRTSYLEHALIAISIWQSGSITFETAYTSNLRKRFWRDKELKNFCEKLWSENNINESLI